MGTDQSSGTKNDTTISPHQERSLSDSARGQKSIPNNAAIGSINLSRVTFKKDIESTIINAAEEADATSFTHHELGDDHSSSEEESESDDDSDDEGKFTPRWEFLVIL
jgi:hypothetical protein